MLPRKNAKFNNTDVLFQVGSVIFMESPAGVGYSYTSDGNQVTNDDEVATDNYNALKYFFQWKFPELKNNDFYITGESYAGVYLPTLGVLIAQDKTNFPTFKVCSRQKALSQASSSPVIYSS